MALFGPLRGLSFLRTEILLCGVYVFLFFSFLFCLRSVWVGALDLARLLLIMPLLTFDKVLKIISTILNILSAALNAFGSSWSNPSETSPEVDENGHS